MNRFRFLLTLFVLPLALAACKDDNSPDLDVEDYAGVYTLQTINGNTPPGNVVFGTTTVSVVGATAYLNENNTWNAAFTGTNVSTSTPFNENYSGTFTVKGNKVTLKITEEGEVVDNLQGTIKIDDDDDTVMTVQYNGVSLVFKIAPPPV